MEFEDINSDLPGLQFAANSGVTATLDVTRPTVFAPDDSILRVPVSFVIADNANAPGDALEITVKFVESSVGFFGMANGGTLAGHTIVLADEEAATASEIAVSNNRTYIDVLFGASAGNELVPETVLDSPMSENGEEFSLSGIGVGTAVLLKRENPLEIGDDVFPLLCFG